MEDQPADPTPPPAPRRKAPARPAKPEPAEASGPTESTPRPRPRPKPAAQASGAASETGPETTKPKPTKATRAQTPIKRMVTAAVNGGDAVQEVIDDAMLAHLDNVIADLEPQVTSADPPASPEAPALEGARQSIGDVPGAGPQWLRAIVADPGFAAEHLADEAVRRLGPQAQIWLDRMRERYPRARPDALAQLAVDEHVRLARKQGLASTTAPGAIVDLGLLGRTQARLVLTVAASYGVDPADPARADELLELLAWPRLTEPGPAVAQHAGRLVSALLVRRLAARLLPFGATIAGSIHSGVSTQTVGRRAIDRYRPR